MSATLMEGGESPFLSTQRLPVPDPWMVYYVTPIVLSEQTLCFKLHFYDLLAQQEFHTGKAVELYIYSISAQD